MSELYHSWIWYIGYMASVYIKRTLYRDWLSNCLVGRMLFCLRENKYVPKVWWWLSIWRAERAKCLRFLKILGDRRRHIARSSLELEQNHYESCRFDFQSQQQLSTWNIRNQMFTLPSVIGLITYTSVLRTRMVQNNRILQFPETIIYYSSVNDVCNCDSFTSNSDRPASEFLIRSVCRQVQPAPEMLDLDHSDADEMRIYPV